MAKKIAKKPAAIVVLKKIKGSSNIESVGYDAASSTLEIQFTNGTRYNFHDVPQHKHEALMKAKSKGKHFAEHIRFHHEFHRIL